MRIVAILAMSIVVGCAETRPDETTTRQGLEEPGPTLPAPTSPMGPVLEAIDWDEARGYRQLDPASLPAAEREKLAAINVPVLAFDDPTLLRGALVTHHHDWYVVAVESADGLNMNVRGTRNAFVAPAMEVSGAARAAAANYTLTRTHGIVSVSWRSFGASYTLDIECARPLDDARCTEDVFALQVLDRLGVIGGQP